MAIVIESVLFQLVFIEDKTWSLTTRPLTAWTLYLCILQLKYVVQRVPVKSLALLAVNHCSQGS